MESEIIRPMEGLLLVTNFISDQEEMDFIKIINEQPWNKNLRRYTQQYGWKYNYKERAVSRDDYLGELPTWLDTLIERIYRTGYIDELPDQVIINRYLPGEGIGMHVDATEPFKNKIYTISLGCPVNFIFRSLDRTDTKTLYLLPKTFYIFQDKARYEYMHGIAYKRFDMVDNIKIPRLTTRYSITFRNVKFDTNLE